MAIRIREVDGHWVAVCAAKVKVRRGDIYLNDNLHHALTTKFAIDHEQPEIADPVLVKLMEKEESKEG